VRVLFLTQLLPLPLDAGAKTRSYYVLRYLAEAGHEVSLACFLRTGDSRVSIADLRRICGRVEMVPLVRSRAKDISAGVASLFSRTPFLIRRDDIAEMWRRLEAMTAARSFDAVHADQLWMAPYGLGCPSAPLRVLDQHNAVFLAARRMAQQAGNPLVRAIVENEATKLEAFERTTCRKFDQVVWVTDADCRAVTSTGEQPNGHNRIIPIATDPREQSPVARQRPFRVTFLGGMHWPPNAQGISWFTDSVWPKVAAAVPWSVLTIIGKKPPRRLLELPKAARVDVAGYLPDLAKFLSETAVFIVPLRAGAGMRVKILDAWCWQLPVVSTTIGAEGMQSHSGENLLLADDEDSFAHCVIAVLRNHHLAQRLCKNGRTTVEENYDWKKVYVAWDQIYR
jgi:glycosyltransferase involved in cell wall biosynthesis